MKFLRLSAHFTFQNRHNFKLSEHHTFFSINIFVYLEILKQICKIIKCNQIEYLKIKILYIFLYFWIEKVNFDKHRLHSLQK